MRFVKIVLVSSFLSAVAFAGGGVGGSQSNNRGSVHCEFVRDEVCNSSNGGMVCRPVFKKICLPIDEGDSQPVLQGGG